MRERRERFAGMGFIHISRILDMFPVRKAGLIPIFLKIYLLRIATRSTLPLMDDSLIADRLCALGNETRLKIYRILVRAGHDGVPVSELQRRTGAAMSTVSHHLHRLIQVGLVYQEREGTTLFCHADYQAMDETLGSLTKVCCIDAKGRAEDAA